MESCRKAAKERVLKDMLGSVHDTTGGGWKVLVLDELTTRVLSSTLRMSDVLDCNISVVEDLYKNREPLPLAAVYFIHPSSSAINRLIEDFSHGAPLYPSVHIFFSSKVSTEAVNKIKGCEQLIKCLKTLKESNIEFLTVDSRTAVTDHPLASVKLMGDLCEVNTRDAEKELDSICSRLSTLLATLNEFPVIRYKQGKAPEATDPPGAAARSTLTQRLSQKLLDRLGSMQRAGQLPTKETCDMIVLDRSFDPVAPAIHEWTYEAMVHDMLELDGNVFKYKVENNAGKQEEKEAVVDESDELWCELRHMFIAEVYTTLANRFKEFQSKNKAAKLSGGMKAGEMSTSNIRGLIQALPQFRELLSKLSLHIQISSDLRSVTNERLLTDVGELEQDLVLGEKTSKEMVAFLTEHQAQLETTDKMRLLMCYLATHPEKLDEAKKAQWMKAARLSAQDMAAVCNLNFLGVNIMKQDGKPEKSGGFFSSKKDKGKKEALRKKKDEDGGYALFRFDPLLKDVVSDLAAGRLSADEYPYIRPPTSESGSDPSQNAQSARTARSGLNWAKRNTGGDGSGSSHAKRLVVFIIGGATRSEMRVAHELSKALGRDVVLASTSVETPHTFMDTLYKINTAPY